MSDRTYPLQWPSGWPRTPGIQRTNAPYRCTLERATSDLIDELKRWRARDITISSNLRTGLGVRVTEGQINDPGVALYWTDRQGNARQMGRDCFFRLRDNVRALGLAIEYLRGLERCGGGVIMDRAMQGFAALPEAPTCWRLLGVPQGSPRQVISDRFRELAATHHPDRGGDSTTFAQLTQAYHEALGSSPQ